MGLLAIGLFLALPGSAEPVIHREAAALPDRYAHPLEVDLHHASVRTSELLRSALRFPLHDTMARRLCAGDPEIRKELLASLRMVPEAETEIRWEPQAAWLRTAHDQLLGACHRKDHCDWLRLTTQLEPFYPGRDLLWRHFARCALPQDAPRFESSEAPIESLVSYYKNRRAPPSQSSPRLEDLVRRLVEERDVDGLNQALTAYHHIDLPLTGETLAELAKEARAPEVLFALGRAMRNLSHPEARRLGDELALTEATSSKARNPLRESPFPFRSPRGPRTWQPPVPEPEQRPPSSVGSFRTYRETGLSGDARLLNEILLFASPSLDDVVVEERWPAVDALPVPADAVPVQIFVNGDATYLPLSPPANGHPPSYSDSFRVQVEEALREQRILDAYLNGERFSVSFLPGRDHLAAVEAVALVNALLEASAAPSRLRILSISEALEVEKVPAKATEATDSPRD